MKCKHLNRIGLVRLAQTDLNLPNLPMLATVCDDCGEWLSIGPSNDAPPEVQVEMRAAELAASWRPVGGLRHAPGGYTEGEGTGWAGWPYRQPQDAAEDTGFLACQIHHHCQDLGDVNWAGHHMADHDVPQRGGVR